MVILALLVILRIASRKLKKEYWKSFFPPKKYNTFLVPGRLKFATVNNFYGEKKNGKKNAG